MPTRPRPTRDVARQKRAGCVPDRRPRCRRSPHAGAGYGGGSRRESRAVQLCHRRGNRAGSARSPRRGGSVCLDLSLGRNVRRHDAELGRGCDCGRAGRARKRAVLYRHRPERTRSGRDRSGRPARQQPLPLRSPAGLRFPDFRGAFRQSRAVRCPSVSVGGQRPCRSRDRRAGTGGATVLGRDQRGCGGF